MPFVKVYKIGYEIDKRMSSRHDLDPDGFRYGEKENVCWEEKKNNDDRCDFYNPDLYSRAGGVLSESFCQQYCSDYTLQDLTPLPGSNAQKRALIMSKLMGSNFKHNTEDAQKTGPTRRWI